MDGDIGTGVECVGCSHASDEHADSSTLGANTGVCGVEDCACEAMTIAEPDAFDAVRAAFEESGLTTDEFLAKFATDAAPPVVDDSEANTGEGEAFEMPIMVLEGVDTGDGRYIDPSVLTWRDLPLPVMGILKTTYGHEEAELVGRLDSIDRVDVSKEINSKTGEPYGEGVTALTAKGVFTKLDNAEQVADLVRNQFIRGVSVDLGDVTSEFEFVDEDGNVVDEDDFFPFFFFAAEGDEQADDGDQEEKQLHLRERMTAARVMGVTICPFPAFEGAYIKLADGTETERVAPAGVVASGGIRVIDEAFSRECGPCKDGAVVAAAGGAPMYPPKSWFEMPEPNELTPLTITDDGRVFGHVAGWQTCHASYKGQCLLATKSRTDYSNFHVGALKTAEGEIISVGAVTMGTGHASTEPSVTAAQAMAHYDNTGSAAARVRAVDGRFGIWVSGALEPDMDELKIRKFRAAAMSGDWRPHGRGVEMIAVLAVNTPGFLVPRATVASGRVVALVAAGAVQVPEQTKSDRPVVAPELASFMDYVLEKDVSQLRSQMQQRHAATQAIVLARGERVADELRARVHGA